MVKLALNLGDLIAAFFGVPGPSTLKNIGTSSFSSLADEGLGKLEEAAAPTTVTQDLDKMFDEIRISNKGALSVSQTSNEYTQSLQPKPQGGSETLQDLFSTLRSMTR